MRPNIDIPAGLHGRVKEVRGQHEWIETLDDAYMQVLEEGLGQLEVQNRGVEVRLDEDSASFMNAVAKPANARGLYSSLAFAPLAIQQDPVRVAIKETASFGKEEIKQLLSGLQDMSQTRSYPSVVATFSQVGGAWHVGGANEIFHQFNDTKGRWESRPDWETHKRELVTIIAKVSDTEMIFVGGQNEWSDANGQCSLRDPWLTVLTDGYPVTGDTISEYVSQLGFNMPQTGTSVTADTILINDPRAEGGVNPVTFGLGEIRHPITYKDDLHEDPWVCGAIVDTPFNRPLMERLLRKTKLDTDDVIDSVLARDSVVVQFLDHHPLDDEEVEGYQIERIRITDLSKATDGRSGTVYNLGIDVRYITSSSQLVQAIEE